MAMQIPGWKRSVEPEPPQPRRVIVVGASSYVGQFLVDHLMECGHYVAATFNSNAAAVPKKLPAQGIDFSRAEAGEQLQRFAESAFEGEKPDAVVNCVGLTSLKACAEKPDLAAALNIKAVEACAMLCNSSATMLLNLSTDKVYGPPALPPFHEATPPSPANAYGETKWRGEAAAATCPLYLNLRLSVVYGPPAPRTKVLHKGQPVPFFTDERLNFVWVGDVVRAIERAMCVQPGCQILNVGGPQSVSRADFAALVAEVRGYPKERVVTAERSGSRESGRGAGVEAALDTTMTTEALAELLGKDRAPSTRAGIARSFLLGHSRL